MIVITVLAKTGSSFHLAVSLRRSQSMKWLFTCSALKSLVEKKTCALSFVIWLVLFLKKCKLQQKTGNITNQSNANSINCLLLWDVVLLFINLFKAMWFASNFAFGKTMLALQEIWILDSLIPMQEMPAPPPSLFSHFYSPDSQKRFTVNSREDSSHSSHFAWLVPLRSIGRAMHSNGTADFVAPIPGHQSFSG